MLQLVDGRGKRAERYTKIPLLQNGKGHLTLPDPNRIDPGYTVRTYDVNLDRAGSIAGRGGMHYLCENPVGAQQIATFEPGEAWTSGSADTTNFREHLIASTGTQGRKITSSSTTLNVTLDLGADDQEFICVWVYWNDVPNITSLLLRFRTVNPGDNYAVTFTPPPSDGWQLLIARKSDFVVTGVPDWTNITAIVFTITATATGATTMDNLYVAPKQVDGLYSFRQSPARGGGNFLLGAARGVVAYLDEREHRWVPLITGWEPYQQVNFATFNDFCYVVSPLNDTKVIIGDGLGNISASTTYDAGIAAPSSSPTLTAAAGGALPAGTYDYRFTYYSTITGREGNSVLVSVTLGANQKVLISGIPMSPDSKVDWVRIYRRDPTTAEFRRVTGDLNGEVGNGVPNYEDNETVDNLGAALEGRPDYVPNSPPPRAAYAAVVGDRLCLAGEPSNPGIFYPSQRNTGEQYNLVDSPRRLDLNDNDVITGLANAYGFAFVAKERAVYVGTPTPDSSAFSFARRENRSGPISHRSIIVLEDAVRYRSHDGFYAMGRNWIARKISRGWDTGPAAPGMVEPTFDQFVNNPSTPPSGAYLKRRGQALWTDRTSGGAVGTRHNIVAVLHTGQLEGTRGDPEEQIGAVGGWAFHRYNNGLTDGLGNLSLEGVNVLAEYIEEATGQHPVAAGGPGGFIYKLDANENDDVFADESRVATDIDIIFPFYGIPGAAMGQHTLKDFAEHHFVFLPTGSTVAITHYYDWVYQAISSLSVAPQESTGDWLSQATPFAAAAVYAEVGAYVRLPLAARECRNIAWRIRNNTPGESFTLSEQTLFAEYISAEGGV